MTRVDVTLHAEPDAALVEQMGAMAGTLTGIPNTANTAGLVLAFDFENSSQAHQFGSLMSRAGTVAAVDYV